MLSRNDYLLIKRSFVGELFIPFLTEERRKVIKDYLKVITSYI